MSERLPKGIKSVRPKNIAHFRAVRWNGSEDDAAVKWLADQYGWKVTGVGSVFRHSKPIPALTLIGRNKHRYKVVSGYWIIALGSNGSLRVVSERQYRNDYEEIHP